MASTRITLLDRYLLGLALRPLGATLAVVLIALLMERLLRLFRLVAEGGGPPGLVAWMALSLVPHYLGLALPAALFLAVFLTMARLDRHSELDALRNAGVSLRRGGGAFVALALVLAGINLAVLGWLQPLGRYHYRALAHQVGQSVWDGTLPEGALVEVAENVLLSAEQVAGSRIGRVYLRQILEDGTVALTTARAGLLQMDADGIHMRVRLEDGVQVLRRRDGGSAGLSFQRLTDMVAVRVVPTPFRPRGGDERELTLPELWIGAGGPGPARMRGEAHARLARICALPFVPLLAAALALKAKRAPRGIGLAVGVAGLFLFHHALLTGETLAEAGTWPPGLALWGPASIFAAVTLALYSRLDAGPA